MKVNPQTQAPPAMPPPPPRQVEQTRKPEPPPRETRPTQEKAPVNGSRSRVGQKLDVKA
jgi:hypothetical protein